MTTTTDFDRVVAAWLQEAGSTHLDDRVADTAFAKARALRQRRGIRASLLGPGAWPVSGRRWGFSALSPAVRVAILVALALGMLAGAAAVGSQLLWRTSVVPNPPVGDRPIVEELGRFATGQISAFGSTLMADGRVLLVGGADTTAGQGSVARAWIFDPTTKRIVPTGAMSTPRTDPLAVTLADGRVLVISGYEAAGQQPWLSTAELYDPATGTFTSTAGLPDLRRECPCGARSSCPTRHGRSRQVPSTAPIFAS